MEIDHFQNCYNNMHLKNTGSKRMMKPVLERKKAEGVLNKDMCVARMNKGGHLLLSS
jgi:hypothetical protein